MHKAESRFPDDCGCVGCTQQLYASRVDLDNLVVTVNDHRQRREINQRTQARFLFCMAAFAAGLNKRLVAYMTQGQHGNQ